MSDKTPRTDAVSISRHEIEDHGNEYTTADEFVPADFARQLERELTAAKAEIERLEKEKARLERAIPRCVLGE